MKESISKEYSGLDYVLNLVPILAEEDFNHILLGYSIFLGPSADFSGVI
jgi:hypothetical protein